MPATTLPNPLSSDTNYNTPVVEGLLQPGMKLPNRMSPRQKEVSATALYVDYFHHDHSFPYKIFQLCGFTH